MSSERTDHKHRKTAHFVENHVNCEIYFYENIFTKNSYARVTWHVAVPFVRNGCQVLDVLQASTSQILQHCSFSSKSF